MNKLSICLLAFLFSFSCCKDKEINPPKWLIGKWEIAFEIRHDSMIETETSIVLNITKDGYSKINMASDNNSYYPEDYGCKSEIQERYDIAKDHPTITNEFCQYNLEYINSYQIIDIDALGRREDLMYHFVHVSYNSNEYIGYSGVSFNAESFLYFKKAD